MTIEFMFAESNGRTTNAYVRSVTFDNVPHDCIEWAKCVASAALQAARGVPFKRDKPRGMTRNVFQGTHHLWEKGGAA